jgi:hypothetical protein
VSRHGKPHAPGPPGHSPKKLDVSVVFPREPNQHSPTAPLIRRCRPSRFRPSRLRLRSPRRQNLTIPIGLFEFDLRPRQPGFGGAFFLCAHRSVPVTTMSTRRLPQAPQTSRACHSGTGISAPQRSAISAGPDSAWCLQSRHHTTNRTPGRSGVAQRHRRTGHPKVLERLAWVAGHRSACRGRT